MPKQFPLFFYLLHFFERAISRVSLIPDLPVLDPNLFSWAQALEGKTDRIRQEYENLYHSQEPIPAFQEISREQGTITQDQNWKTFVLYAYGAKSIRNCELCPETTKAIEQIPGMKTAFFSILSPGKEIPQHRGPYKGVVRCHLGLVIPEGSQQLCGIQVADTTCQWSIGKTLFFDDSFIHSAWNRTNESRVVLFIDFLRPLKSPFHLWNDKLIHAIVTSKFGQRNRREFSDWYRKLGIKNDVEL